MSRRTLADKPPVAPRDSRSTMAKSPSAFATHSRVIGFIENLALLQKVALKNAVPLTLKIGLSP